MFRTFAILTLFLLATGIFSVSYVHQSGKSEAIRPIEAASNVSIHLVGYSIGWNNTNPTITVTQGDTVTINLSSGDAIAHLFLLDMDNDGYSDQSDCGSTSSAADPCSTMIQQGTSPTLTFTAGPAGNYTYYCTFHPLTMRGTFIIQQAQQVQPSADFTLTASPTIVQGVTNVPATSTITVNRTGGLDSSITFTTTITPSPGLTCAIGEVQAPPAPQTSQLSCTSAVPGNYTVTVTGIASSSTGGIISRSTSPITFHITSPSMGFTLAASPTSITCPAGSMQIVHVTVTDTGGFNGMVTLSPSVNMNTGLSAQLGPQSVTGSGTSTLTLTCTTAGNYQVTVTGTSGTLTPQSLLIPVTVTSNQQPGSFTISASPITINVLQGCQNMSIITLTSNRFTGNLTLSTTISPTSTMISSALSNLHVQLGLNQSKQVTLTVSAGQNATIGTYSVTVTAMSGSISNSVIIHVNIVPNACNLQGGEHESCAKEHDDDNEDGIDHSDQNGTPCNDSSNPGAQHGIGNCANEDRDDHHHNTRNACGCPLLNTSHEEKKHHEHEDTDDDDNNGKSCTSSCTNFHHGDDDDNGQGSNSEEHSHPSHICTGSSHGDDSVNEEDSMVSRDRD